MNISLNSPGDKPAIVYKAYKVDAETSDVFLSKARLATYLPLLDSPSLQAVGDVNEENCSTLENIKEDSSDIYVEHSILPTLHCDQYIHDSDKNIQNGHNYYNGQSHKKPNGQSRSEENIYKQTEGNISIIEEPQVSSRIENGLLKNKNVNTNRLACPHNADLAGDTLRKGSVENLDHISDKPKSPLLSRGNETLTIYMSSKGKNTNKTTLKSGKKHIFYSKMLI
jgi:hypothetical protein